MNIWENRLWSPMLLKEIKKPFDSNDYLFEVKFDGIRALIFVSPTELTIQSRNKKDITYLFPELKSISSIVDKKVIFDGEIVAFENGMNSFAKIQERIHLKKDEKIKIESFSNPVTFVVFDILYEDKDLTNLPLEYRKKYLNCYQDTDVFIKSKVINKEGKKLFKSVKKLGLEGIVAKAKWGKYHINKRTDDFIKIKNIQRDQFTIGGFEKKKNGILSLALGEFKNNSFHFVGKASIGKNHKLYNQILNKRLSKNYFCDFKENINYLKPDINCHVEYLERTKKNHLRHPIIKNI